MTQVENYQVIPETILFSGNHLIELEFARPVSEEVVRHALQSMGFSEILLDQSLPIDSVSWGKPGVEFEKFRPEPIYYRFIGKLIAPLRIQNTELVKWIYQHPIHSMLDPFEDKEQTFFPFNLESNKIYDLQFLARMRSQPTRNAICETLAIMGFKPMKVMAIKRNMRLAGRPNTSITRWYAIGEWNGPDSFVSSEDPLYFENLKEINT